MAYKDKNLVFTADSIYFDYDGEKEFVMMEWERPLMEKHANYVCENGGDILEIGFGMGISADYIQANNINSHTIVEIHPDILNKAYEWAEGKSNINIIAGDWYNSLDVLSTYDGIFLDTFGDDNIDKFKNHINSLAKSGCKISWWNNSRKPNNNTLNIEGVTYEEVNVTPPLNGYFDQSVYYLPKKQI